MRHLASNKNKITKVCLENVIETERIYFLIKPCPRINYLPLNFMNTMQLEIALRHILSNIDDDYNQNIRSLYFGLPTADNITTKELKEMIDSEKLLFRYSIERERDSIYLFVMGK